MSCPWNSTLPWVGVSSRLMQRSGVDFPLPEAPIHTGNIAVVDGKVNIAQHHVGAKDLERWRTSMMGSDMGCLSLHIQILGLVVRVRGVGHMPLV